MKVESDVNVLSEEDSIDMKSEEVHIRSGFSITKGRPQGKRCFQVLFIIYVCISTHAFMYFHLHITIINKYYFCSLIILLICTCAVAEFCQDSQIAKFKLDILYALIDLMSLIIK
jgi:hypothetical protein